MLFFAILSHFLTLEKYKPYYNGHSDVGQSRQSKKEGLLSLLLAVKNLLASRTQEPGKKQEQNR